MNIGRSDVDQFIALLDKSLTACATRGGSRRSMTTAVQPLERNLEQFPDLHPALDSQSALAEANRCLFCFDAPCTAACPTHIDVPRFIKKIASEQSARFRAHYSRCQYSGPELFTSLPGGCACAKAPA